ncbi:MAG: hypothetical protein WC848_06170 [Parcubacteria group bacterium]|jgi:preprotein translocase subunit YajC
MDRKKIIIPIIALIILFGGALFIAQSLSNKKAGVTSQSVIDTGKNQSVLTPENVQNPTTPVSPGNQGSPSASGLPIDPNNPVNKELKPGTKADFGTIDRVDDKSVVLKLADKSITVNIASNTIVTKNSSNGKVTTGSLSDLAVGDLTKVSYHEDTKKIIEIVVMKIDLPDDTKKLIDLPQP